jgi:heme exporter protein B
MKRFGCDLVREFILQGRQRYAIVNAGLFYAMVMVFFPLEMSSEVDLLRQVLPGLVWIAVLFMCFLSIDRLFYEEHAGGVIEQWLMIPGPVHGMIRAKLIAHVLTNFIPLIGLMPILMLGFALSWHETMVLLVCLLCGSPTLVAFCGLAAAFSLALKQKSVLMALVILPLTLPVMIIGSGAMTAAMQGLAASGELALLLAISLVSVFFLPCAISAVLRAQVI